MNILVTGANGQLGISLRRETAGSADRYIFADVAELDITDAAAIDAMADRENVDIIVNCAAYTNVDKAEDDEATAYLLNAEAVGNLARTMARRGGWLIHVSTDYVFGGVPGNTPRTEDMPEAPTGAYGRTKLAGEKMIAESGVKAVTLPTPCLYSEYGRNFLKTMLQLTHDRDALKVVVDQAGTPTYAGDLAKAIEAIIAGRLYEGNEGIYHYSDEGVCSWYDFTRMIYRLSGGEGCRIAPCRSDEYPSKAVRPAYSVLDKTKFKTTFGLEVPYWVDSLEVCINNMKK